MIIPMSMVSFRKNGWISSPGLRVVSEDVEEGVDAGFELPGSKNVGEMGNIAFPPVEREEEFYYTRVT